MPQPKPASLPAREQPEAVDQNAAEKEAKPKKSSPRRRVALIWFGVLVVIVGCCYGYYRLTSGRFMVSTDDAYVKVDIAVLGAKVSGYVWAVPDNDNAKVRA